MLRSDQTQAAQTKQQLHAIPLPNDPLSRHVVMIEGLIKGQPHAEHYRTVMRRVLDEHRRREITDVQADQALQELGQWAYREIR